MLRSISGNFRPKTRECGATQDFGREKTPFSPDLSSIFNGSLELKNEGHAHKIGNGN